MNKKIKIIITLMIIFVIVDVALFLFNDERIFKIGVSNEIIPQFTNNEEINKIIFDNTLNLRKTFGVSVLDSNSLVNLVHVVKERDSNYEISCEFGPAYKTANLNKFYPEELVSMGQIKDCTTETARIIDEAINSSEKDCRVPMDTTEAFFSINDYYLILLDIKEHEITQEWVDKTEGKKCFEPLENLIGERIAMEFIVGVIDIEGNIIFY
ncbi:MAG: hypothetical protein ACTSUX_03035 [Promethearchaeota archaeon]